MNQNDNLNIPKHWQVKNIGEALDVVTGTTPSKKNPKFYGIDHPFYKPSDLDKGTNINNSVDGLTDLGLQNARFLPENSVLVTCIGATIGKTGIISRKGACNQQINALLPNCVFNPLFLYYQIISEGFQQQIKENYVSTTLPLLNKSKFEKLRIVIPPLPEQQAIVVKIEELLSDLENGKQQLLTAQQQLKVYRQSLLKAAFEGKLTNKDVKDGKLPKGWTREEMKEVCEIKRGKSKHRPRNEPALFGGNYPFIQTGDIREANGGYINRYSQTYSEFGLQQSKLWPKGTLCITIAANIGETAILNFDACFPDSVVGLLCNEKLLLNKYANYFFISHKSKLEELAPATAQKNINVDILEKVKIPIPSINEQQLIIDELESKLTVCDKIEETITQSLQQAEMLKQSILKRAFEGKLIYSLDQK